MTTKIRIFVLSTVLLMPFICCDLLFSQSGRRFDAIEHIQKGDALLQQSVCCEDVLLEYSAAVTVDPSYYKGYVKRARVLSKIGREQDANNDIQQALTLNRFSSYLLDRQKKFALLSADYEGSISSITNLSAPLNNVSENNWIKELLFTEENYLYYPLNNLNKMEKADSILSNKRRILDELKKNELEASRDLLSIYSKDSYHITYYLELWGIYFIMKNQADSSIAYFNKAINNFPENHILYYYRSLAYRLNSQSELAIKDLDLIPMDSSILNLSYVHSLKGLNYKDLELFDQASVEYTNALNIKPDQEDAKYNLIITNKRQGNFLSALHHAEELTKINDQNSVYWNALGNAQFMFSEYDDSVDSYNNAISLNIEYAEAYMNRGIAKIMNYQIQDGCNDIERSIHLDLEKATEIYSSFCD